MNILAKTQITRSKNEYIILYIWYIIYLFIYKNEYILCIIYQALTKTKFN